MSRRRIAVYGSLRKDEYNYDRFVAMYGQRDIKVLSEGVVVKGFNLYDLGPYPAITLGENELTIDILSVEEPVFNAIDGMEKGAGYDAQTIKVPKYGDVTIYTYPRGYLSVDRLVESGDWSAFLKNNKK